MFFFSLKFQPTNFLLNFLKDDIKLKKLRLAVDGQHKLMKNARDGKGIDRHLFGLWCAAYEENIDIPELYDDPLYKKR